MRLAGLVRKEYKASKADIEALVVIARALSDLGIRDEKTEHEFISFFRIVLSECFDQTEDKFEKEDLRAAHRIVFGS